MSRTAKLGMHLNLLLSSYGAHWGAWRLRDAPADATTSFRHFRKLARMAEQARFDSVFVADIPGLLDNRTRPLECLDPTILLASLAATTSRIGLIATISTTYSDPYNVARKLASLDHLSYGRAGWNIVTSDYPQATANFDVDPGLDHAGRYRRAAEFVHICTALWDSWREGALVADKTTGIYADSERIWPVEHGSEYFHVRGPLQVPPSPQGWPVLAQAGASNDGRDLAASFGELIYTIQRDTDSARAFAEDIRTRCAKRGRDPHAVKIMPGLIPVLADTDTQAAKIQAQLDALVDPDYAITRLAGMLNVPVSILDPNKPLPEDLPPMDENAAGQGRRALIIDLARKDGLTARQIFTRLSGGGHLTVAGTPRRVADVMEEWFLEGAADGFTVMPPTMPAQLEIFISTVVPILRERGLYRMEYEYTTMREHYGLPIRGRSRG
jgi:FMN-dependent oxidoreductase (nitrilotriacetate monooxygenase family)